MAFSINCTNKGCGKLQEAYMDPDTNQVMCSECNREISNISIFVKNQMKQSKNFRKKTKKPFAVKCESCKAEDKPKIINDKVLCSSCSKEIKGLTPYFINMLKNILGNRKAEDDNI